MPAQLPLIMPPPPPIQNLFANPHLGYPAAGVSNQISNIATIPYANTLSQLFHQEMNPHVARVPATVFCQPVQCASNTSWSSSNMAVDSEVVPVTIASYNYKETRVHCADDLPHLMVVTVKHYPGMLMSV
jgi:hypothetical protein